jgi:hypothetical protein
MVKGTINGFPFQTALEPDGVGNHWLHVDKPMQGAGNVRSGDTTKLDIEATKDWPEPDIPKDIYTGLATHRDTKDLWGKITPMARWEWIRWINSTASADTRAKRIEVSRSKMLHGDRRPCCFNRNMCCVPQVSKSGILIGSVLPAQKRSY